jgi:hypothetical protein
VSSKEREAGRWYITAHPGGLSCMPDIKRRSVYSLRRRCVSDMLKECLCGYHGLLTKGASVLFNTLLGVVSIRSLQSLRSVTCMIMPGVTAFAWRGCMSIHQGVLCTLRLCVEVREERAIKQAWCASPRTENRDKESSNHERGSGDGREECASFPFRWAPSAARYAAEAAEVACR